MHIEEITGFASFIVNFIGYLIGKFKKKHYIDINYKNVIIAPVAPIGNRSERKLALILYGLKLVNRSKFPLTFKSVLLKRQVAKTKVFYDSYVIQTGTLKDGKSAIILSNGLANICLVGWRNLREQLGNYKAVPPGGVLAGSAVFLIEEEETAESQTIKWGLIIEDYSNHKTSYLLKYDDEWKRSSNEGFVLVNKRFSQTESGEFIWE